MKDDTEAEDKKENSNDTDGAKEEKKEEQPKDRLKQ